MGLDKRGPRSQRLPEVENHVKNQSYDPHVVSNSQAAFVFKNRQSRICASEFSLIPLNETYMY